MADQPTESKGKSTEPPAPEVLKPEGDGDSSASTVVSKSKFAATAPTSRTRIKRVTYRPSHRATFIGIAVVIAILGANVAFILYLVRGQANAAGGLDTAAIKISPSVLNSLGVSRNPVGDLGTELIVGPDSKFNGKVTVGSDVSIRGDLSLNSTFIAPDANLSKLEAGNTSLSQLNVNGDATATSLTLRKDLSAIGISRLQGPVTISGLTSINNSLNVVGNLAVGGTLTVRNFEASSLTSDTTLTIGGHVITNGSAPSVSGGSADGSNGTVSISGNDAAGTVAVNVGTGGGNGTLANISFRHQYGTTPHVIITPIGHGGSFYVNRNINGFSIAVSGALSPGGYAFDYIVMQ